MCPPLNLLGGLAEDQVADKRAWCGGACRKSCRGSNVGRPVKSPFCPSEGVGDSLKNSVRLTRRKRLGHLLNAAAHSLAHHGSNHRVANAWIDRRRGGGARRAHPILRAVKAIELTSRPIRIHTGRR